MRRLLYPRLECIANPPIFAIPHQSMCRPFFHRSTCLWREGGDAIGDRYKLGGVAIRRFAVSIVMIVIFILLKVFYPTQPRESVNSHFFWKNKVFSLYSLGSV